MQHIVVAAGSYGRADVIGLADAAVLIVEARRGRAAMRGHIRKRRRGADPER
jgi:hypothetical protein